MTFLINAVILTRDRILSQFDTYSYSWQLALRLIADGIDAAIHEAPNIDHTVGDGRG